MVLRSLPEDRRDEETVRRCMDAFRDEYAAAWDKKTEPFPGVPELLDALAEHELPVAVFSNKPDDFTKLCVQKLLPRWRFRTVIGAGPDTPHKPDPAGAKWIAETLGVPPAQMLYVGDTNTDMQTANAAGMFPVGVTWGFRPAEELLANGAAILITEPRHLLKLL
jgi:phosphoglycolate phosphatase